jgi:hypothetical protein
MAIRAGVFLRPGGFRAIEQSLGGYRETIAIPIDELLFLGRIFYLVLSPMLSVLCFPFWFIPHSAIRILQEGPFEINLQGVHVIHRLPFA